MKTGFVAILLFLFIASCNSVTSPCGYMGMDDVCVTVYNKSGENIKELTLTPSQTTKYVTDLADKQNTSFSFVNKGEGLYTLLVVFASGDSLKTDDNYIEGGYTVTETVYKDSIVTDNSIYK